MPRGVSSFNWFSVDCSLQFDLASSFSFWLFECGVGSVDEFSERSHWPKNPGKQTSWTNGLQRVRVQFLFHWCQNKGRLVESALSVIVYCMFDLCRFWVFISVMHGTLLGGFSCHLLQGSPISASFLYWRSARNTHIWKFSLPGQVPLLPGEFFLETNCYIHSFKVQ
jgi:hypothetical protein